MKEKVLAFLDEFSRWGFTVSRMVNWGGDKADYAIFKNEHLLRYCLADLLDEKKVRTRISKNGSVLYQTKK